MGCGSSSVKVWTEEDYQKYKRLMELWESLDKDHSGTIEMKELRLHLHKQTKSSSKKIANSVALAFDILDVDGSGNISFFEFMTHNGLKITPQAKKQIQEWEENEKKEDTNIERVKSEDVERTRGEGMKAKARKHREKNASKDSSTDSDPTKSPKVKTKREPKSLSGEISPEPASQIPRSAIPEAENEGCSSTPSHDHSRDPIT